MEKLKIAIAGAGIMGRLLAWQLVQQGHEITLVDRDPIEQGSAAAYTAAGMLTPYSELESTEWLIYLMGMKGIELWPGIIESLQCDVGFSQRGSLVVAHQNDAADLKHFQSRLNAKMARPFNFLNKDQLTTLEPELAKTFTNGIFLPEESWLCTKGMMASLADKLLEKRICWHSSTEVTEIKPHALSFGGQTETFDWVIDCRGLGAKKDMPDLRGVRGELIWVDAPEVNITRMVRLMHPRYRLYLVPRNLESRKTHLYVLGATQIESEDYSPISVRSSLELLSALYSLHPGFAEARIVETKTNCRPALLDNLPKIECQSGLIRINGLFRHGFLLAPVLAESALHYINREVVPDSPFKEIFKMTGSITGIPA